MAQYVDSALEEELRTLDSIKQENDYARQNHRVSKTIFVGYMGVGKTCLGQRITKNCFDPEYHATIGVDFHKLTYSFGDDSCLKVQIWDMAGNPAFQSVTKIFYRSMDLVIFCYAIDDLDSFERLHISDEEIDEMCSPDTVRILVGCKLDQEANRQVSPEAASQFAREKGLALWTEVSAKDDVNVEDLFYHVSKLLYNRFTDEYSSEPSCFSRRSGRSLNNSMVQPSLVEGDHYSIGVPQRQQQSIGQPAAAQGSGCFGCC